ncbi:MAG: sigma-70 family RNA polymerase sigma factor [Myxococcaceae bacterium]|nr:sigma-70 family RNA polymerase sigma factor [Myxococcaceae bacterium]MCA3010809.1 sigma-70 family RNA polymerase sigma factor [Myxococcaceae bacterium]
MSAASDESLYLEWIDGDLRAFDALYERYEGPLYGFLRRQLGDAAAAEDAMHETFLALLKERERGRRASSLKAWVFEVARHLVLNRARTMHRARRAHDGAAHLVELEPAGAPPDELLQHRQATAAVTAALSRLPAPLVELYRLRAQGLSYDELAAVLCLPLGTVKSRLHELVKRLQQEVSS